MLVNPVNSVKYNNTSNVKNNNTTISQTLRSVFYSISSNDAYQVGAQHSGIVTATGIK